MILLLIRFLILAIATTLELLLPAFIVSIINTVGSIASIVGLVLAVWVMARPQRCPHCGR